MRPLSVLLLLLPLAACQSPDAPSQDGGGQSSAGGASRLERAAIATGVIADASQMSPVGLYRRRHEAGQDMLCVVPGARGELRFGMEARLGAGQNCRGRGNARRAGDKLILSFSGGDRCIIVATYEGDQVALPGVVDLACSDLCEGRASLEGVSFPRIASDAAAGLRAIGQDGGKLCDS